MSTLDEWVRKVGEDYDRVAPSMAGRRDHVRHRALDFPNATMSDVRDLARRFGLKLTDHIGGPVPDYSRPTTTQPTPEKNPHRRRHDATEAVQTGSDYGVALDDLLAFGEHRERRGFDAGYAARSERAARELEVTYDDAWRAGMIEQHDAMAAAFGDRLHALHDYLNLLPTITQTPAQLVEAIQLAHAVVDSVIQNHGAGPFAEPTDRRPLPETTAPTLAVDGEPVGPAEMDRRSEEALRGYVTAMREWLKAYLPPEVVTDESDLPFRAADDD